MTDTFFTNADGELLIVPQLGTLQLHTELGILDVSPQEIALIPRGLKFQVKLEGKSGNKSGAKEARGYICENYGKPFELPYLGPIGANGPSQRQRFFSPYGPLRKRRRSL